MDADKILPDLVMIEPAAVLEKVQNRESYTHDIGDRRQIAKECIARLLVVVSAGKLAKNLRWNDSLRVFANRDHLTSGNNRDIAIENRYSGRF